MFLTRSDPTHNIHSTGRFRMKGNVLQEEILGWVRLRIFFTRCSLEDIELGVAWEKVLSKLSNIFSVHIQLNRECTQQHQLVMEAEV